MPLRIQFIGHSTVRVDSEGLSFLTDPIFSERIFWLRRRIPCPIDPGSLPPPQAIFVSHAHYDHLDLPSYKFFPQETPILTPPGLSPLLKKFLANPIVEITPGSIHEISPRLQVKAIRVSHYGFRLSGIRYTHCNGYLVTIDGKNVFFPGDTGYRPDFANQVDHRPIDCALLPIAAYRPTWLMRPRHLNPEQAVRIFEEIGARTMVPIHWGTFKLSSEPLDEPIRWLQRIIQEKGLQDRVRILEPGQWLVMELGTSCSLHNSRSP